MALEAIMGQVAQRRRASAAGLQNSFAPLAWTTAALLGGILLHVDRVPFWATGSALICIAWRVAAEFRIIRLPRRYAKIGVAFLLIAAVIARFQTFNGLSAGTALLVVMGAIKLLETHARRDRYVVIGASLFLLLAACLDRQSLMRAPLYLAEVWICCTALGTAAHDRGGPGSRVFAVMAARSLLLALPLGIVLFLFFPRVVGAFWVLPQADSATTGLSDTMSPGSISSLSELDDPAFRVRFDGAPPPPEERYWRGPVLHDFDGYTWRRTQNQYYVQPALEYLGPAYRYHITLEPNSQRWWFALDTVTGSPSRRVLLTFDYQLLAIDPVTRPTAYDAVSHTHTRTTAPLSIVARRHDTRLTDRNPRSRNLARELRGRAGSDAAYVSAVLNLFRRGGFEYTLTPPRLDLDSVDDFIFNTKRGFCGHYASAFVMLMRAAGVPSRVVTGYLGGEWNPIRQYFVVRQSDAHAWAEVWLDGLGWQRIDPTAVVAPERLQRGIADLLPDSLSMSARFMRQMPWIADARQRWDAVNDWWNERVVRFDFRTQTNLLRSLGFDSPGWTQLGWLLASGLIGWLLLIAWHMSRAVRRTKADRLGRAYVRLCAKLARAGAPREPHEGPLSYAESVAARRPDLAEAARALLRRYADLRYGNGLDADARPAAIVAFERAVSRLSAQQAH